MRRYFLTLGYDGSAYHGWQQQPGAVTVQDCLDKALSVLLRTDVEVVGAGRTDAGVHARTMVAHFDAETDVDCPQLVYKLNRLLPPDIAVRECREVDATLHARLSAFCAPQQLLLALHARLRAHEPCGGAADAIHRLHLVL